MKFFKKVGYSIGKIEKYAEMATDGVKSALLYLAGITVILTVVFCLGSVYRTHQSVQKVAEYIENEIPEFSYKDGNLSMEGDQHLTIENEEMGFDKIIIDVQDKTDEEIEQYKNTIKESGNGILILKDKVQIIGGSDNGEVTYVLKDIATQLGMNEFSKADVINYLRGNGIYNVYLNMFLMMFVYAFIMYFIEAIWVAVIIAVVGYVSAIILKTRMRYKAIFNMAVYAMTLSIILQTIYLGVNTFTQFTITYFDIMYIGVAFIYLISAIFLTRIDLSKQQEELTKVEEAQKEVKKEIEEKENKEKEEKEKETDDKKEKEKKKKTENKSKRKQTGTEQGGEPEGSNV